MGTLNFFLTFLVGYAAVVLFFFARRWERVSRTVSFVLLSIVVLGCPTLLSTRMEMFRCAVTLALVICLLHMWDLQLDPQRRTRSTFQDSTAFLLDLPA